MSTKLCSECKETKPLDDFPFRSDVGKTHLRRSGCRDCQRKRAIKYYNKNKPDKQTQRERNLKKAFGITIDDYNELLQKQNSCCAICGSHSSMFERNMAVDHCHDTLIIRGILCKDCNTGLGQFKDSTTRLKLAIEYLEKFNDDKEKI